MTDPIEDEMKTKEPGDSPADGSNPGTNGIESRGSAPGDRPLYRGLRGVGTPPEGGKGPLRRREREDPQSQREQEKG